MRNTPKKIILAASMAVTILFSAVIYQSFAPVNAMETGFGEPVSLFGRSWGIGSSGPELGNSGEAALGKSEEISDNISPTYIIDGIWAKVDNFSQLKEAVGHQQPYIRLTSDMAMEEILALDYNMTLDGKKEGEEGYYTITERYNGASNTFRLTATHRTITVQNLNIMGYDYYGFVSQRDTTTRGENVTVIYQNVNYTGPQIAWIRYDGTLILRDCNLTIQQNTGGDVANEVGEAIQFIIGGNTTIHKVDDNSLFWIVNDSADTTKKGLLKIEDNANVTMYQNKDYLLYRDVNEIRGCNVLVGDNVTLDMKMTRGWLRHYTRPVDNFIIGNNSKVTMSRTTTASLSEEYLFTVQNSMTIGVGSTLVVEEAEPPFFLRYTDVVVTMNNPEEVRLDKYFRGTPKEIKMIAKTFNTWTTSAITDAPDNILTGPMGEEITMIFNSSGGSASYIDEATGELVAISNVASFDPRNTALNQFVLGNYDLNVDPISSASTDITGTISRDSTLSATYFPAGADTEDPSNLKTTAAGANPEKNTEWLDGFLINPQASTGKAFADDQDIAFELTRLIKHENSTLSRSTRMYAKEFRAIDDYGSVYIESYPEILNFGRRSIPAIESYIPLFEDAQFVVHDTRNTYTEDSWYLKATANHMSNPDYNKSLGDAVGIMRNGQFTSFGGEGALVWEGIWDANNVAHNKTFQASDDKDGLVVRVSPTLAIPAEFNAVITWTLTVGL